MKYQCNICGKEFTSYNPNPQFCSLDCKVINQTAIVSFEEARRLYEWGLSQVEVGRVVGVSQKVIYGLFRRNGYKGRKAAPRNQKAEANNNWKFEGAGYSGYHRRMEAMYGKPKKCAACGVEDDTKVYDWANLTGEYDDPNDYKRMCRSCHAKYDKKIENIKHMRKEAQNA